MHQRHFWILLKTVRCDSQFGLQRLARPQHTCQRMKVCQCGGGSLRRENSVRKRSLPSHVIDPAPENMYSDLSGTRFVSCPQDHVLPFRKVMCIQTWGPCQLCKPAPRPAPAHSASQHSAAIFGCDRFGGFLWKISSIWAKHLHHGLIGVACEDAVGLLSGHWRLARQTPRRIAHVRHLAITGARIRPLRAKQLNCAAAAALR